MLHKQKDKINNFEIENLQKEIEVVKMRNELEELKIHFNSRLENTSNNNKNLYQQSINQQTTRKNHYNAKLN